MRAFFTLAMFWSISSKVDQNLCRARLFGLDNGQVDESRASASPLIDAEASLSSIRMASGIFWLSDLLWGLLHGGLVSALDPSVLEMSDRMLVFWANSTPLSSASSSKSHFPTRRYFCSLSLNGCVMSCAVTKLSGSTRVISCSGHSLIYSK